MRLWHKHKKNFYADVISNIKALEEQNANPTTILRLKKSLRNEIVSSSLINEFNKADDKQQFIENVRDGKIETLLTDINDTFKVEGFETGLALTNAEGVKYANQLNTLLRYDIASGNVERQTFATSFKNWYETSLLGLDAGDTPNIEDAKALFFNDVN